MEKIRKHLYGLIFAGGGGTRLWPLSRQRNPKQFLKLFSSKTLLRETFERISPLIPPERIFVVTMEEYANRVASELPEIPREQIIREPERKNTASAVFLGSIAIYKKDPDAIIANFWSDHEIGNLAQYRETLLTAFEAASDGSYLVATGVQPTFPHTGLGYIKYGERFNTKWQNVFKVERFIEKPEFKMAEDLLDSGSCLWNIGLYVWKATSLFEAFNKYAPEMFTQFDNLKEAISRPNPDRIKKIYSKLAETQIDKAIAEKASNLLVVAGEFLWSDIGDFQVLWERTVDGASDGNSTIGINKREVLMMNSQGILVSSDSRQLIAGYGLRNLAVIVTPDVILIVPRDESQKVKEIVNFLKKKRKTKFL